MRRSRLVRKALPATLLVTGCPVIEVMDAGYDAGATDAGTIDAGYDAGTIDAGPGDAGTDAGATDAGTDAGMVDGGCAPTGNCVEYTNPCGERCGCVGAFLPDAGLGMIGYCDPDIGNPCPLGCFNPKEADGGRMYMGTNPVCYC